MTVEAENELDQQGRTSKAQQHGREDGVGRPGLPVLGDAAGESDDEDDVGREGVTGVTVQQEKVRGDEDDDLGRQDSQSYRRGGGDADVTSVRVGDDHGEVEEGGDAHPRTVDAQPVVNQRPDQPDVNRATLGHQLGAALVQRPVAQRQGRDQGTGADNQSRKRRFDVVPVEEEEPGDVAAVGQNVAGKEGGRENSGAQVDGALGSLAEEVDEGVQHPQSLEGVDEAPDGEGPASWRDIQVVLVRLVPWGRLENSVCEKENDRY